jgi:DNA mismatch repair protein MutS2
MQAAVLRALEFDRIREALARDVATPLGRERAQALEPATDPAEVARRLALTGEAVAFAKAGGSLAINAQEDLPEILIGLDIADEPLAPLQLVGLARFVESVDDVTAGIRRAAGFPGLTEIAARAASFAHETAAVHRAVLPTGEISDAASPALREIRDGLRRARAKLRSSLESLTHGRDASKYLQDQIVTDRNGRYVVVVRAEHRGAVPGIVHGASASGASLYVEPMSTVELNNDVVALVEREKEEIRRILLALTDGFRRRADELEALVDVAADLDEVYGKARLASRLDGLAPELTTDGRIEFKGARHPLLLVRKTTSGVVSQATDEETTPEVVFHVIASDLIVAPPYRALVISGPNTGGKTVALKAFGLLALMAQAGLHIPVDPGSRFTPFTTMFADIGDEQSIAASLSTFSAHIAHLVGFERELDLPALVLLDEVGSGTDPVEGGALGAAVIDHFRRRGALVVATTHDDALKSYASTTEGVMAAAFGFNPETYAPTYRLMYGAPGRSLALEIAERLGMPSAVVADARTRRSGRESLLAAHLARVDKELAAVEQERARIQQERDALARERQTMHEREARLTEREAILKKRLDDKLNEKLREARAEVDAVVTRLKSRADALAETAGKRAQARGPVLSTGEVGELRSDAAAELEAIGRTIEGASPRAKDEDKLQEPPTVGQSVFVTTFGATGIVRGVSGDRVDVEVRGMRMRVNVGDLRLHAPKADGPEPKPGQGPKAQGPRQTGKHGTGNVTIPATAELVLIGATVDDAIGRVEKFLDGALLGDERQVRIVHGHGTGKLRDALRAFLREHPLVSNVSPAPDNQGGNGATIVELKD